jgi:hypothetical protein
LKPGFIEAADILEPIILVSVIWLGVMISAAITVHLVDFSVLLTV